MIKIYFLTTNKLFFSILIHFNNLNIHFLQLKTRYNTVKKAIFIIRVNLAIQNKLFLFDLTSFSKKYCDFRNQRKNLIHKNHNIFGLWKKFFFDFYLRDTLTILSNFTFFAYNLVQNEFIFNIWVPIDAEFYALSFAIWFVD
jgi:hypothetical protein